jgi:hypothetical protein
MDRFRFALLVAAGAIVACASAASATPTSLFGNTLQITGPDGGVSKIFVNADGSYSRTAPDGTSTSGSWSETDSQMCFTQQTPTPGSALCGPKITQSTGDNWTGARPDGAVSQLTIVSGR